MRLVYTTHDADGARSLAQFLSSENIENQLEMATNTDWGQADYGVPTFRIWVIDEDAAESAEKWAAEFHQNPKDVKFQKTGSRTTVIPTVLPQNSSDNKASNEQLADFFKPNKGSTPKPSQKRPEETNLTISLLLLCCILYLISSFTAPHVTAIPANLPATPFVSPSINKDFFYDYPAAYEIVDKLIQLYGVERLQSPQNLPPEGQSLLQEFHQTPYWNGIYDDIIGFFQNKEPISPRAPLFEKIREGEFWRLFTPCLLHSDFLHILFNMMWLIVLGKQLEQRLSPRHYLLLILIIGIFSNTCQYLMSGPNFLGFSGVICGMVGFIWVRQWIAPWEGYPLEKATSSFIIIFISVLLAIQMVSFYLEIYHHFSIAPGIANTAHLAGALIGVLLGCLPLFKKQTKARITK
jgi:GlpG protein